MIHWRDNSFGDMYSYKGYSYCPEEDRMEDNIKVYHNVYVEKDGIRIQSRDLPLSPYYHPGLDLFKNWIDMGQPTREQLGGQQIADHTAYYEKWVTLQLEKELDL